MTLDLSQYIRTIPDYPKTGILFRDITTLIADGPAFRETIDRLAAHCAPLGVGKIAAIESRGFLFGAPLAAALGIGFVPIRKPGKLPGMVISQDYSLEYGQDRVEMHVDATAPGEKVVLVDDLIATGGTALAALSLIRSSGAVVQECLFVVELPDLGGRPRIEAEGVPVHSLVRFDGH